MAERVDDSGPAYAGSQLQTQLYVNERAERLESAVRAELPRLQGTTIEWRSPLASDRFREYSDRAFLEGCRPRSPRCRPQNLLAHRRPAALNLDVSALARK